MNSLQVRYSVLVFEYYSKTELILASLAVQLEPSVAALVNEASYSLFINPVEAYFKKIF